MICPGRSAHAPSLPVVIPAQLALSSTHLFPSRMMLRRPRTEEKKNAPEVRSTAEERRTVIMRQRKITVSPTDAEIQLPPMPDHTIATTHFTPTSYYHSCTSERTSIAGNERPCRLPMFLRLPLTVSLMPSQTATRLPALCRGLILQRMLPNFKWEDHIYFEVWGTIRIKSILARLSTIYV